MKLVFVKFGGSLITDKSKPYTARPEVILRLASELKKFSIENPDTRLIIGNGAGSFAHTSAKKYGTAEGFKNDEGGFGFAFVQNDAVKLNRMVVEALLNEQVPAVGVQPSAFMVAEGGAPGIAQTEALKEFLRKGMIPVVFGDPIIDKKQGSTIFSTDTIFKILVKEFTSDKDFEIKKVVSAGDYDGVKDADGNLIKELKADDLKNIGNSEHTDVTGGMIAKVKDFMEIASLGVNCFIMDGTKEGNLLQLLEGEDVECTKID